MQYMAIPRLLAIAELGWSKPEQKDWSTFQQRLSDQFERLNIMGINYRIPDLEGFNAVNAFIGEGAINVTCLDPTAEIHYTTDGSTPTLQSPVYEGPIKVTETTDFTFCTFRPNGKKGDIVKTRFIKSEYTPSVTAAPSNPGLKATWHEFKGNKCSEIEKAPVNGTYPVEDVMIPKKVKGNIEFDGEDITNSKTDEIARKGIFMSFQLPEEIPGISVTNFLKYAKNKVTGKPVKIFEFKDELKKYMEDLNMNPKNMERSLNVGFSGGEKKKNEILQMLVLNPKLAILDETDSGLDVDAIKTVSKGIEMFKNDENAVLIITHNNKILHSLKVDYVHVLVDGKIVATGTQELATEIEENGYSKYKKMSK